MPLGPKAETDCSRSVVERNKLKQGAKGLSMASYDATEVESASQPVPHRFEVLLWRDRQPKLMVS
ncbi:hypothetical protein PAAG_00729 [Paracoccidioides lutzii Pb01]|uniref:Uncharacterized protein n=1 Tax=Paracoccidioides lutzii (strain ATCC MYA-826 / Pb01) TaxID=502779 RepID=C1GQD4_PARBA|nr:hypothetical protein PAAG_00729 [Paracoccidioides lutzii Pb01]EEH37808.2 hypothetical protein PAAG_00729 [Paracoccidioides lutzii Pb01]